MSGRVVVLRRTARQDVDEAVDFYIGQGAHDAAFRLVDELETDFKHLSRFPETGSPRYAQELSLPGLRHWPVQNYPYVVFYVVGEEHVDIWRVLHAERDLPEFLRPEG